MRHVGPRHEHAPAEVAPVSRAVPPRQRPVGEPRRPGDRPVQPAPAEQVFHHREVLIVLAEHPPGERGTEVPHEQAVAGIVPRRVRPRGRWDRAERGRADHDDPADAGQLHRTDDRGGAARGDPGVPPGARPEPGQHGVGPLDRADQRLGARGGEVRGNDPHARVRVRAADGGERRRVAHHRGDVVAGGQCLGEHVPADPAGRGQDGELHGASRSLSSTFHTILRPYYMSSVESGRPGPETRITAARRRLTGGIKDSMRDLRIQLAVLNRRVGLRIDLKDGDLDCLDVLVRYGPLSPSALARRVGVHPATMTGVIDRLERAGWVARDRAPDDRRAVVVRPLRDRAGEIFRLYAGMNASLDEICAGYDEAQLAVLADFLHRAVEAGRTATDELAADPG